MFKNLLKPNPPLVHAGVSEAGKTPAAMPGETPLHKEEMSALSAAETEAWREKISGAASDDATLLNLARQAPSVELKVAALEALTQEDALRQAMREFREGDKRLYRAAKTRWQTAVAGREALTEANTLIASARGLLQQEVIPVNRIVELDRAWSALNVALLEPALVSEFTGLSAQLGNRVRARGETEQAITRWLAAVESATRELHGSLPGVAQGSIPPAESETLAARLLELLGDVADPTDARCIGKTDAANRALALASSVVQRAQFLQALPVPSVADEGVEKAKIEQWREFPEVSDAELQAVLASRFADWRNASTDERQRQQDTRRAAQQKQNTQERKMRLTALQRDVEAAEMAHAAGRMNDLTRLMTVIDQALKAGPADGALGQRIEALRREQLRLRDWQRWSGRQRREELVTEAEALARAAGGKVAIKEHAEAIDKLRQRWKDLDKLGGATNQSLWLAFDGALKVAYGPVAAHQEKLKAARAENLAARNQIIDGLAQAAAQHFPVVQGDVPGTDVKPDWRAIARVVQDAQIAWRKLGPIEHTVPREAQQGENAVAARYAKAFEALEGPLKNAYGQATRQREELIAAAKAITGSGAPARDAVDKVRKLQAQWQIAAKGLPLPRREENGLWAAFKSATDAVFTALDAARAAREAESTERFKTRQDIIERVSALSSGNNTADIKRAMAEAETAWRAAPEIPRPHATKFDARYRAARDAAARRIAELGAHASRARFDALIAAMALCRERETAAASAEDLEPRWNAIEHLPDPWKARLEARFRGAIADSSRAPAGSKSGVEPPQTLPEILLNLEVACSVDSPPEFLAARQQLKLRALKNAMETRRDVAVTPADIERWLLDAAAMPNPDDVSRERLEKIIAAVRLRQTPPARR